jgi:hypothetical protein
MQPDSGSAGALAPVKKNHLAAITEPKALGTLLRTIGRYEGPK